MCHKCNNLHLQYLKSRKFSSKLPLNTVTYSFLLSEAKDRTAKMLEKIEVEGLEERKADIALFSIITESRAIDFAQHYLGKIHLEKDVALAKTIEHLVTALTLVQSKAVLVGNDAIALDVRDALDEYHTKHFKFGQSATELKAILDSDG